MSGSTFALRDYRPGDEPEVRRIVTTVLTEYGLAPECGGVDADLEDIHASYIARGGAFRILEDGHGAIVGCGGLFPLDAEEAEIRKMYFLPAARGQPYIARTMSTEPRDQRPRLRLTQLSHGAG